jgi:hypothetical protein
MTGKTTATKILVRALQQLHQAELNEQTNLFIRKKADMMEIRTFVENGQIFPLDYDPITEAKIKVKPEELPLILDTCHHKGIYNITINPKAVTIS